MVPIAIQFSYGQISTENALHSFLFLILISDFHVETHSRWDEKAADGPYLIDRLKPYQMQTSKIQSLT